MVDAVNGWSRFAPDQKSDVNGRDVATANLAANDKPLIVEVSPSVVSACLYDDSEIDVSPFDLYESIIRDQKVKIQSAEFVAIAHRKKIDALARRLADTEMLLLSAEKARDAISDEFMSAPLSVDHGLIERYESAKIEVEAVKSSHNALSDELASANAELSSLKGELSTLKDDLVRVGAESVSHLNAFKSASNELEAQRALYENKLAASEGKGKEVVKYYERLIADRDKSNSKLKRENEVAKKDLSRFKDAVATSKRDAVKTVETLRLAVKVKKDMEAEIADLRKDRRYLTMMIDSMIHEDFFTCDAGGASIFSFQTVGLSSPDSDFIIDENYPVALWLSSNGFSCVMGVSLPNENGDRDLVMPFAKEVNREAQDAICPPAEYIDEIINRLMEFDVTACNSAIEKTRSLVTGLAINAEALENAKLSNKDLIAVSRFKVAGRLSTPQKRAVARSKRKK